jgi:hypothetical protein
VDTGSPQKDFSGTGTDWHVRIEDDVNWAKLAILERNDMCTKICRLVDENNRLHKKLDAQSDDLAQVKVSKERVEVKASRKEMEDRVRYSATQIKLVNVDLGKSTDDRKEMLGLAKAAISGKIRSDLKQAYDEKIRAATFKVISSKTFKSVCDGKEVWTAPVLITIPEKETRWDVENLMRKSKIFPGFHWPKEMMDNIKRFRQVVKDMGFPDNTHFIRLRPEERDGVWRIRADVKSKEPESRFMNVAAFEIPPLNDDLKIFCAGWEKPIWKRGSQKRLLAQNGGLDTEGGDEEDMENDELTAEDIIMNL